MRTVFLVGSAVVLQLYLKDMGATPFTISLLEVLFWSGLFLFAPLWGAISDTSGRRKLFLVFSIGISGLIIPVFGYLDMVSYVLGLKFVFAVFASAFPPVALAVMSEKGEAAERGKNLAPYNTSRAIGFMIGWGASGALIDFLGFDAAFTAYGIVGFLGLVAALLVTGIDNTSETDLQTIWTEAKDRWLPSIHDTSLTENGLHYLFFSIFLRKLAIIGIMSLIAVYVVDVVGFSASLLGILLALNPFGQFLFIDLFGTLADRYGRRKVFLTGLLLTLVYPLLLATTTGPVFFAAAFLALGVSFAAFVQGTTAFIGDVAPEGRQGEFMGFRKSSQGLAGMIGPLLAGYIATVYGYTLMLYLMTAVIGLSFIIGYFQTEESLESAGGSVMSDVMHFIGQHRH
ncbi:MAG: MFS transporter [Candidatus Nanohaloarchaea archaeon]|nr:MFS transporter [Candidatus Nanohaloarchaea archaeon]